MPADPVAAAAALERLVRRLRGLSPRAWSHGGRAQAVRRLATDLGAIGAPGRQVPEVPDFALADVIAVLGHDALDVPDRAAAVRLLLEAALEATR